MSVSRARIAQRFTNRRFYATGKNSSMISTMEYQEKLPRLGIPALRDTLDKYVEYVSPLISQGADGHAADQVDKTRQLAQEFARGEGAQLQQELERLDAEAATSSWLAGFWDTMYLTIRDPLPVNVNPYFVFKDDPLRKTQSARAAGLMHAAAQFHKAVLDNTLPPDMEKDSALCMAQYPKFFGSARIPHSVRDRCPSFGKSARHIVVCIADRFFSIDAYTPSGEVLCESDFRAAVDNVLKTASESEPGSYLPLSVLTGANRDSWAANRAYLERDVENAQILQTIDSALFVLVLEPESPNSLQRASELAFYGDTTNRWFDKLQLVVCGNGTAAMNIEHTPIDGHTALRFVSEIPNFINEQTYNQDHIGAPTVRELKFNVDKTMGTKIEQAHQELMELVASNEHVVMKFDDYGASWIKKNKFSPDGFVQMAFQQAYYNLTGKAASTYESAMTKKYKNGRTETLRSVTAESVQFTKKFADKDVSKADKLQALRVATEAHVKRMNEAKNGKAVDRHLWTLHKLAQHKQQRLSDYTIPAFYQDPAYSTLTTSVLSTSNCGSDALQSFGFGAVVPEGLGLGYMIHSNTIPVTVSSFKGEAAPFATSLQDTLRSMRALAE